MPSANDNEKAILPEEGYVRVSGAATTASTDPPVRLDVFEGPLSHLLTFARDVRLDRSALQLRDLTDQLASFSAESERASLYDRVTAVGLGAEATAWKARGLLPPATRAKPTNPEGPGSDAVAKRDALKRTAKHLDSLPRRGRDVFGLGKRRRTKAGRRGGELSPRALEEAMTRMRERRRPAAERSISVSSFTDGDGTAVLDRALAQSDARGPAISLRDLSASVRDEFGVGETVAMASLLTAAVAKVVEGTASLEQAEPWGAFEVRSVRREEVVGPV